MSKLIVCLTGMPGSGKSTIADGLREKGFAVVSMGDEVRAEAGRRNLEPTAENLGEIMLDLRRRGGPGAVAALAAPKIRNIRPNAVIVDGIRSEAEIEEMRKSGSVKTLSVHASAETRFGFLSRRGRSDDPKAPDIFRERDKREVGIGIGCTIALADETISNNRSGIGDLVESALRVILLWMRENEDSG